MNLEGPTANRLLCTLLTRKRLHFTQRVLGDVIGFMLGKISGPCEQELSDRVHKEAVKATLERCWKPEQRLPQ